MEWFFSARGRYMWVSVLWCLDGFTSRNMWVYLFLGNHPRTPEKKPQILEISLRQNHQASPISKVYAHRSCWPTSRARVPAFFCKFLEQLSRFEALKDAILRGYQRTSWVSVLMRLSGSGGDNLFFQPVVRLLFLGGPQSGLDPANRRAKRSSPRC